jgi:hypothetical protein
VEAAFSRELATERTEETAAVADSSTCDAADVIEARAPVSVGSVVDALMTVSTPTVKAAVVGAGKVSAVLPGVVLSVGVAEGSVVVAVPVKSLATLERACPAEDKSPLTPPAVVESVELENGTST